ncbi:hypothetical protein GCM10020220_001680 [Nonomuraea rubra]
MRLSLRARLLSITVALLAVGLVVIGSVVVRQLEHQLLTRVDAQLAPMSRALSTMPPELLDRLRARTGQEPLGRLPTGADQGSPAADPLDLITKGYAGYLSAGGAVLHSFGDPAGPGLPRLDAAAVTARAGEPFTVEGDDGQEWRAVVLPAQGATGHSGVVAAVSLEALQATVNRVRAACLVAGSVLLAVLALVGGIAIRAGLAPLRRVEETAAAIAGGDLSRRVPEPAAPGTEVGRLARSLNTMLAQIEQGVAAKVESEARMRRFVADVSHELRTPLFGIKGFSELYRMGGTEAGPAMARIESESGRLAELVDDLLLLAGLDESDGPGLDLTPDGPAYAGRRRPSRLRRPGPVQAHRLHRPLRRPGRQRSRAGRRGPAAAGGQQPRRQRRHPHARRHPGQDRGGHGRRRGGTGHRRRGARAGTRGGVEGLRPLLPGGRLPCPRHGRGRARAGHRTVDRGRARRAGGAAVGAGPGRGLRDQASRRRLLSRAAQPSCEKSPYVGLPAGW